MMKLTSLLIAGLGLVSSAAVNVTETETGALTPTIRMTPSAGTWQEGYEQCRAWGMYPLSIHNEATNLAAQYACNGDAWTCWFGIRKSPTNNGPAWYYDDGTTYDYTQWNQDSVNKNPDCGIVVILGAKYAETNPPTFLTNNWMVLAPHDAGRRDHMLCGDSAASKSPMASPSRSPTPSVTVSASGTSSSSMSASNTPGVCRSYCVGDFGLCQNPIWEDFTCYPHDGAGNCPVNTVSCPDVIEADTVVPCQSCAMGTSGSCQHPENGLCTEHLDDTGVCPPGLTFCGASF